MADLESEARRRVHVHAVRPLLVPLVLPDIPKILPLDDDRVLHPGRHDDTFEHLPANGESDVEWTLRIRARRSRDEDVDPNVASSGASRSGRVHRGKRAILSVAIC